MLAGPVYTGSSYLKKKNFMCLIFVYNCNIRISFHDKNTGLVFPH